MTAPTAGPWTYGFPDNDHESTFSLWRIIGPDTSVIAEVVSDVEKGITGETVEANARLIAAAPDLLQAAKRYIETPDQSPDEVGYLFDDLVSAIAKAEGRS